MDVFAIIKFGFTTRIFDFLINTPCRFESFRCYFDSLYTS